jgi:tetratricopeptide (TPR) repeat protein
MRHLSVVFAVCLALSEVVVVPALAEPADEPAACAVESKLSLEEVIGICGLVIGSNATSAIRVHALVTRAELHRRLEHYDLAMADCEEAIRLDPASAEAFDGRGNVLTSDKKFERALDDFDQSIRLDPKFARAFADRAVTFGLMHEPRLAVRDYTEAVRLDPNNVLAHVDRAEAYVKVRRADLAIDDYGEAIRLDPSSPDHYDSRGSLYARNNAYDRAIADFNEAIRLLPKASYFLNRGNAHNLKGDPDRAIADYNEALRLEPELAMAYNNRGVAWRDKGDKERALADFNAAVRIGSRSCHRRRAPQANGARHRVGRCSSGEAADASLPPMNKAIIASGAGTIGHPSTDNPMNVPISRSLRRGFLSNCTQPNRLWPQSPLESRT